jgi:Domain of unknown function (DUF4345)
MAGVVLVIAAIFYVAFGLAALAGPGMLVGWLGIETRAVPVMSEIRASYGGLYLATGLLLVACARNEALTRPGLLVVAVWMAGLAGARIFSVVLDGMPPLLSQLSFASEVVMSALAGAALAWG